MDSFELNKIIGALLAAVFVIFSVSIVSDSIFATHAPSQPGYAIEVAETGEAGGEAAPERPSVVALLPDADPDAGQGVFRRCAACHTAEQGGANRAGPNLWNVVGHQIAAHEGFSYSTAMRDYSEGGSKVWDYETLSAFLASPRTEVPGTAMAFAGIRNPQEEANLIAYLRTLSDDPQPLPEPAAAEEQPDEAEADSAAEPAQATPQDEGTGAGPQPDAGTPAEGTGSDAGLQDRPAADAPAEAAPQEDADEPEAEAGEAPAGEEQEQPAAQ